MRTPRQSRDSKSAPKRGASDRPKRRSDNENSDRPKRSYNREDRDEKPKRSYTPRENNRDERPKRRFDSDNGDRPKRSFNRDEQNDRPKRSYTPRGNDGEDRPKRSYNRSEGGRDERPKRRFDNDNSDRPKRPYTPRGNDGDDRPRRSFNRDEQSDRPKRSYTRRENDGDDRPKRRFDSDNGDRPKRSFNRDEQNDRPKRPYTRRENDGDERPKRPYTPRGNDGDDRPRRSFNRDEQNDRPKRSDTPRGNDGDERPKRSYNRSEGGRDERPKRRFDDDRAPRHHDEDRPSSRLNSLRERITRKKNPPKDNREGVRLNKYIADSGICSRREADNLIISGAVKVNGEVCTVLGTKVTENDKVSMGDQMLNREKKMYLLLNKPKDYITTSDDPQERKTVMHLIKGACRERIYPVGRLDRNTTGVLLFTNDGDMAKRLTHPTHGARKIYHVTLDKPLTKTDMTAIADGFELEDGPVQVDQIEYVDSGVKTEIGVQIHSGRNRIVRRIFEKFGYEVTKLDRVLFAELTKKDLSRGEWRFLTEKEISFLKMIR